MLAASGAVGMSRHCDAPQSMSQGMVASTCKISLCMYACMCIYMCVFVCVNIYVYVGVYVCIRIHTHRHICIRIMVGESVPP